MIPILTIRLPRNGEPTESKLKEDVEEYCARFRFIYVNPITKELNPVPGILVSLDATVKEVEGGIAYSI